MSNRSGWTSIGRMEPEWGLGVTEGAGAAGLGTGAGRCRAREAQEYRWGGRSNSG